MGAYKRKLKRSGVRWWFIGQYRNVRYHSPAIYKTRAEALKAERVQRGEIDKELESPSIDITFFELSQRYLDHLRVRSSKEYYNQNRQTLKRCISLWGDWSTKQVTREEVQLFLDGRANDLLINERDRYSVNKDIRHLKAMFYYGMEALGLTLAVNPVRGIKFYPVKQAVKFIPSDSDIAKVLLAADQFQQTYLMVLKNTLARSVEVNRLKVEDIDLEGKTIMLRSRKTKSQDMVARTVGINSELLASLKSWLKVRDKNNSWVFCNGVGSRLDYQRWLPDLCLKAGVQKFGFHSLRHRGASLLLKKGQVDVHSLMEILGHSNLSTTQRYIQTIGGADWSPLENI